MFGYRRYGQNDHSILSADEHMDEYDLPYCRQPNMWHGWGSHIVTRGTYGGSGRPYGREVNIWGRSEGRVGYGRGVGTVREGEWLSGSRRIASRLAQRLRVGRAGGVGGTVGWWG